MRKMLLNFLSVAGLSFYCAKRAAQLSQKRQDGRNVCEQEHRWERGVQSGCLALRISLAATMAQAQTAVGKFETLREPFAVSWGYILGTKERQRPAAGWIL
jgi:hypothetical protein